MNRFLFISLFCFLSSLYPTPPKALIFGITGQDGAYLAEFLIEKGYEVHGVKRRSSSLNTQRLDHFYQDPHEKRQLFLHYGDITDSLSVFSLIRKINPDEIYNLAAQSHVKVSFELPEYTAEVDALGTLRILEAVRRLGLEKKVRYYQASTSELYGGLSSCKQTENTPFYPRSPYGVSKLFSYWATINYREAYGIFACNGILFNHESPLRGETFVTKKITRAAANIALGTQRVLYLGNLDAQRDWGYAKDYVEAMWRMLQQKTPDDYVIATGQQHSVREFAELAFKEVGIDLLWQGTGIDEVGINRKTDQVVIRIDPAYFRPTEVQSLLGDCTKAMTILGWHPKTSFEELVKLMVKSDYEMVQSQLLSKKPLP